MVTLGKAAQLTGTSKTTLTRAIRAGRLSAIRQDDGSYRIDPAELSRVYALKAVPPATVPTTGDVAHHSTPSETPATDPELQAKTAALEAELKGLRELVAELRQSRDDWRDQAQRLALTPPKQVSQPWWKRLTG